MSRIVAMCPTCNQSFKKINDHIRTKHPDKIQKLTAQVQDIKKFRVETNMITDVQLVSMLGGKTEGLTATDVVAVVQKLGVSVVAGDEAWIGRAKICDDLPAPPYIAPFDVLKSAVIQGGNTGTPDIRRSSRATQRTGGVVEEDSPYDGSVEAAPRATPPDSQEDDAEVDNSAVLVVSAQTAAEDPPGQRSVNERQIQDCLDDRAGVDDASVDVSRQSTSSSTPGQPAIGNPRQRQAAPPHQQKEIADQVLSPIIRPAPRRKRLLEVSSDSDSSDYQESVGSEGSASSEEDSPQRKKAQKSKRRKQTLASVLPVPVAVPTSTDDVTTPSEESDSTKDSLPVVNPSTNFRPDSMDQSKAMLQNQGMNQMFCRKSEQCDVLDQYYRHLVKGKEMKENQANTQVNNVSRYAYFALTKQYTDSSAIANMDQLDLSSMFSSKDYYEKWLQKLKDCNVGGEGRKNHEKALKSFSLWYKGKTDDEGLMKKIDRFHDHLVLLGQTTARQITKGARTKTQSLMLNPEQIKSLAQIQSFLKLPSVVDKRNEIVQKTGTAEYKEKLTKYIADKTDGSTIDKSIASEIMTDFMFLVGNMLSIVGLKNCHRIGVMENMRIEEWKFVMDSTKSVQTLDDGTIVRVVYVFQHKTSTKQPAYFTLDEDDYNIFKLYYDIYRPLVALTDDSNQNSSPFLLNSKGERPGCHGSQMLRRFQKTYGGSALGEATVGEARHALETLNFSGRYINNQTDQDLVATYIAHSYSTGKSVYKLPTASNIAKASSLLKVLMSANSGDVGSTLNTKDKTGLVNEAPLTDVDAAEAFPKELSVQAFLAQHPIRLDRPQPSYDSIMNHCQLPQDSSEQDRASMYNRVKSKWYYRQKKLFCKQATDATLLDGRNDELVEARANAACQTLKYFRVKGDQTKKALLATVTKMVNAKLTSQFETINLVATPPGSLPEGPEQSTLRGSAQDKATPSAMMSSCTNVEANTTSASDASPAGITTTATPRTNNDRSSLQPSFNTSEQHNLSGQESMDCFWRSSCSSQELSSPARKKRKTNTTSAAKSPEAATTADSAVISPSETPSRQPTTSGFVIQSTCKTPEQPELQKAANRKLLFSGLQMTDKTLLKQVNKQTWPKLDVKSAGIAGRGVFVAEASDGFGKDEYICDYNGRPVSVTMFNSLTRPTSPKADIIMSYAQEVIGKDTVILAHNEDQSYGRLINHSPHATCVNVLQKSRTLPDGNIHVLFYAKRPLKPGEQLFRDYGKEYANIQNFKCLNPKCPRTPTHVRFPTE